MILEAMRTDKIIDDKAFRVICGCAFCQCKEQRKDVDHYKLFHLPSGREYYLSIDQTNSRIEIVARP